MSEPRPKPGSSRDLFDRDDVARYAELEPVIGRCPRCGIPKDVFSACGVCGREEEK